MGDFFQTLFENWELIPSWARIFLLIGIMLFGLGSILSKFIPFAELLNKKSKDSNESYSLKDHHFFEYIEHLLNLKVKTIDLDDDAKNYIMLDILMPIKIKGVKQTFLEFISENELNKHTSPELKKMFVNQIYTSIKMFEESFLQTANTEDEKIITKIILSYFNEFYLPIVEMSITLINDIFDSSMFLNNNISKVNSALYIMIMPLELFFESAEKTFKKMNGDLQGKLYHGKKFK